MSRRLIESAFFIDRDDQTPVERHGHADVDVLLVNDVGAIHRCVDDRHFLEALGARLRDERHVGELAAGLFVLGFLRLANLVDLGEVDLERRMHVRRCAPAHHHVLGDLPAHHAHRRALVLRRIQTGGGRGVRRQQGRTHAGACPAVAPALRMRCGAEAGEPASI